MRIRFWLVRRASAILLMFLPLAASGCGRDDAEGATPAEGSWNPQGLTAVSGVPVSGIRPLIQQRMSAAAPAPLKADQWRRAQRLYQRFGTGPLWFGENGLDHDRVAALMSALVNAHTDALRLERYPLNELSTKLVQVADAGKPTAEQVAEADVLLTATYAALGKDLLTGQVEPRSVSKEWHIDPQEEQVDSALTRALREEPLNRSIGRMRPQDDDYLALRRELVRYRQFAAEGGFARVPAGKALKPGDTDSAARLTALRRRMEAEGLLASAGGAKQPNVSTSQKAVPTEGRGAPTTYDAQLAGAVAAYQARHGIVADSVLGEGTVASMNTPAGYRVGQIAANLERYRWLPRQFGSRYILVNVPAFRLEAYDQGKKALEMKVIVGEEFEGRITPVFSDSMEYVVFRPYWLVTDDIASKELLPKIQADPGYLAAGNYEFYQGEGKTRIRQKPGPENSLGLVKFIFPNDYNIYLHDTPDQELFKEDVRAFSHGCIRVEKPDQLANYVLGWPPEKIREAMHEGPDDKRTTLPRKIPVYIAYFTAYTRNGQPHFANDLYRRDDPLIAAIGSGASPDPQMLKALDSLRRFVAEE